MRRALGLADRLCEIAIMLLMAVVVVAIFADVVARYVFDNSIIMANELSRLAFIWLCFLMMPLGVGRGLHVAITAVEDRLPAAARALVIRAGALMCIGLMVVVLLGAWTSIGARSRETLNTLPLSAAWFFYPVLIGAALSIVHLAVPLVAGRRAVRAVLPGEGAT